MDTPAILHRRDGNAAIFQIEVTDISDDKTIYGPYNVVQMQ